MRLRINAYCALMVVIFFAGQAGISAQQKPPLQSINPSLIGHHAPEILRTDLNGQSISLAKLRGRVVLLNFWASWCGPCLKEMPQFGEWAKSYGEMNFAVIGISIDDDQASAQKALEKMQIHYPVAMGDAKLGNAYGGVLGAPITFLIDRKGVIRARYEGEIDTKVIEQKIQVLMKQ